MFKNLPEECIVLAVDPGGATGWVRVHYWYDKEDPGYYLERWGVFQNLSDEIASARLMYKGVYVVVTESYIIRPDTFSANVGAHLQAVEVIGRVALWARQFEVPIVHLQSAAQAKQQWTDRRLRSHFKHHHLYSSGSPGAAHNKERALCRHEVDALRHAMTYLENAYGVDLVLVDEENLV